ncbi:MAG TPA: hypothetical protein VHS31_16445 [Tepidisphaeraceae bacterium]|nr:hypothetical protein [Tepidisphaeraceae bacterium]
MPKTRGTWLVLGILTCALILGILASRFRPKAPPPIPTSMSDDL